MADFNCVVVGAGTAGCVLAGRRPEDPGNRAAAIAAITRPGRSIPAARSRRRCLSRPPATTQAPAMAVAWIAADLIREGS